MVAKTIYPPNLPLLAIGLMAWIESRATGPTLFFDAGEIPGDPILFASPITTDDIESILSHLDSENLIRYRRNLDSFTVAIISEVQKMDLDLIRRCIEPEKGNGESVSEPTKSGFFVRSKAKSSLAIGLKSEPEKAINAQIMPENIPIRGGGLGGVSESGEASEAAYESKPAPEDPEIRKPPKKSGRKSYKLTDEGKAHLDELTALKSEKEKSGKGTDQVEQICDWIGEFRAGVLKSAGVKKIHPAKWTPKSRRAIDVLLKAGYDIDDFKTAWTAQSNSDLKDRDPKKWKLFFTHSTIHREKNFARLIDSSGDIEGDASKAGESSWSRSSEPDPTDSMDQVPF